MDIVSSDKKISALYDEYDVDNDVFLQDLIYFNFEEFNGIEERYRRRYVDLIMNEESKNIAFMRPRIIRCIQNFMDIREFSRLF